MTAPTRKGVHARLEQLPPGSPPDFRPGRTLRLRVEFVRQLKRRRTQFALLLVLVLPIVVALAFKLGGSPTRESSGPTLIDLATTGGSNFTLFVEFAANTFLLVVLVALFCGDTVASEASWASLRYLLAMPVPRARLLRQKLIVALSLSFAANLLLPVWSFAVGTVLFGGAPAKSPTSGSFTLAASLDRLLIVVLYICGQLLVVAALAFLLSVTVDNPLGAVGGATMLVVLSNIIDQITALGRYRKYLPTHFQFSWLDALGPKVVWDDMLRGTGVALIYAAVFLAVAWLRFDRKDVTS
ncbi:MAG: ABC transporter permease [Jatrophihabitantaceae bacterium]